MKITAFTATLVATMALNIAAQDAKTPPANPGSETVWTATISGIGG